MSKDLIVQAGIAAITLLLSAGSVASDWKCYGKKGNSFEPCFYAGAGLGYSRFDPDESGTGYDTVDNKDGGWLLYGGYRFDSDWFLELEWVDMGKADVVPMNPSLPAGSISYEVPNIMAGYYVDLHRLTRGAFPELPVDPFIKIGVAAVQNSASAAGIPWDQDNNAQLALGAGIEWRFQKNWKMRGALESYDKDALFLSLSLAYVFGEVKTVKLPPLEQKVEVVRPPVPEPVVHTLEKVVPVVVVPPRECPRFDGTLEGVVFKVNSHELTESSRVMLLNAATVLRGFPNTMVEIQAHTDSDGSAEYNRSLSARRAEAVKAFFVEQGINADRLTAAGYGEDRPIANNATPDGKARNRRVELLAKTQAACE